MSRTKKPCPGCGYSPGFFYRDAEEVCETCKDDLKFADEQRERRDMRGAELGFGFYRIYSGSAKPSYGISLAGHTQLNLDPLEKAMILITDLLREDDCDIPKRAGISHVNDHYSEAIPLLLHGAYSSMHDRFKTVVMREDRATAVEHLHLRTGEAITSVLKSGIEYGASLTRRLATGEITQSEFDATLLKTLEKSW